MLRASTAEWHVTTEDLGTRHGARGTGHGAQQLSQSCAVLDDAPFAISYPEPSMRNKSTEGSGDEIAPFEESGSCLIVFG